MTKIFGGIALLLASSAAPALAQDGPWTGGYVGVQLGYNFLQNNKNESVLFDTNLDGRAGDTVTTGTGANAFSPGFCGGPAVGNSAAQGCRGDKDRIFGGIHAGYDVQMGNLVLGVVADYNRTNVRDSVTAFSVTPASYTLTRRLKDTASFRARAGVALDNTLIYATGGVAYGKIKNRFTTTNTVNTFSNNGNDDAWGYRLGAGVEHKVTQNVSVGLLYTFTDFNDDSFRARVGAPAPAGNPFIRTNPAGTDFRRSDTSFGMHGVALTASYRF